MDLPAVFSFLTVTHGILVLLEVPYSDLEDMEILQDQAASGLLNAELRAEERLGVPSFLEVDIPSADRQVLLEMNIHQEQHQNWDSRQEDTVSWPLVVRVVVGAASLMTVAVMHWVHPSPFLMVAHVEVASAAVPWDPSAVVVVAVAALVLLDPFGAVHPEVPVVLEVDTLCSYLPDCCLK